LPAPHLHRLNFGPEDLPPTSPLDLRRAWRAAHMGAEVGLIMEPGEVDGISFKAKTGDETKFMFADLDAACWAAAIDRTYGLETTNGVSLLFRLLALIEIMSEARWLQPFFSLSGKDGATLSPALLAAAASVPLSKTAAFEIHSFKLAMGLGGEAKTRLGQIEAVSAKRPAAPKRKTPKKKAKAG
jgi:hypothetical protein